MSIGNRQRIGETLEAAVILSGFGQLKQAALGILDLRTRREIDRRVIGDIDHVLADADQIAAERQIIDRAAIILRVDDGGGFGGEAGEILRAVHAADVEIGGQEGLECDRGGRLGATDQAPGDVENLRVDRLEEMRSFEKIGHAIERFVVDEDGAKQGLLGLDIMRRDAIIEGLRRWYEFTNRGIGDGHGAARLLFCQY